MSRRLMLRELRALRSMIPEITEKVINRTSERYDPLGGVGRGGPYVDCTKGTEFISRLSAIRQSAGMDTTALDAITKAPAYISLSCFNQLRGYLDGAEHSIVNHYPYFSICEIIEWKVYSCVRWIFATWTRAVIFVVMVVILPIILNSFANYIQPTADMFWKKLFQP